MQWIDLFQRIEHDFKTPFNQRDKNEDDFPQHAVKNLEEKLEERNSSAQSTKENMFSVLSEHQALKVASENWLMEKGDLGCLAQIWEVWMASKLDRFMKEVDEELNLWTLEMKKAEEESINELKTEVERIRKTTQGNV